MGGEDFRNIVFRQHNMLPVHANNVLPVRSRKTYRKVTLIRSDGQCQRLLRGYRESHPRNLDPQHPPITPSTGQLLREAGCLLILQPRPLEASCEKNLALSSERLARGNWKKMVDLGDGRSRVEVVLVVVRSRVELRIVLRPVDDLGYL